MGNIVLGGGDFPCRCCCQAVKEESFCSLFSLTLGIVCWLLLNTTTGREAVPQHRAKPVSLFLSFSLCTHIQYIHTHYVYSPIYTHLVFFPIYPASLRVSSVSVVRSDHTSICVSWRPVAAVSAYRIVIQALRGTSTNLLM